MKRALERVDSRVAAGVFTALAAVVVHGRSVWFGFTGLDDRDLIVDDHAFLTAPWSVLRAFTRSYMHVVDASHGYYRPIVTASFALDARWSGLHPAGYHATNVAVHTAASLLLLVLLRDLAMGARLATAAAVAFAVHPALASAVAWIPGRNDSLLAVFALASWIAFARDAASPSWAWRGAHAAAFALALLTKETAVVIPLVCIAYLALARPAEWGPWLRSRRAAYLVVSWTAGLAGFAVLHAWLRVPAVHVGRQSAIVLLASAGQLLVPFSPGAFASAADLSVWPGILAVAVLSAASLRIPGVRRRVVVLGATAFVLTLAPTLALGDGPAQACRLEWPACGALIAVVEVARAALRSPPGREGGLAAAIGATAIATMAAVTVAFESSFRDPGAFARQAVADAPNSSLAHVCLGRVLQADGEPSRALAEYRTALSLGPAEVAHNNIAVIDMSAGLWTDAERELRAEIELQPGYARAYANLAIVLRHLGRADESRAAQEQADALASGSRPTLFK